MLGMAFAAEIRGPIPYRGRPEGESVAGRNAQLAEYKRKRRFDRTPEPRGKPEVDEGWSFVVQKHDATRLHYDFRLELDGVLKSWAVPKGPSLDPTVKRLAVHVEDHPVEYGGFEGVIPEGEYGGGTVLLWDRGRWEAVGDPRAGFRQGKLKFKLHGKKLKGGWTLVRTRRSQPDEGKDWLLFKERDAQARPIGEGDILDESPESVASGRDLEAIAAARDRVWGTDGAKESPRRHTRRGRSRAAPRQAGKEVDRIAGAARQPMPESVEVQLATLTDRAPDGDEWLHEIKFDGYRMICRIDGPRVEFVSRNQQSWTDRLAPLVAAAKRLPVKQALLDGEVVAIGPDGTSDFQSLQNAFRAGRVGELQYYAFDLLHLDGVSLLAFPLEERKRVLKELLAGGKGAFRYSDHVEGQGPEFVRNACKVRLEGIVSKRRDRPYRGGRGYDWLKTKCLATDEFVIGGFTDPSGSREGFGALLIGSFADEERFLYRGKVGTGFDDRTLRSLLARLKPLEQRESPFHDMKRRVGPARTAHWVRPQLVAQVAYGNRTCDGRLRHASFQGLREDKTASEVANQVPLPVKEAVKRSSKARRAQASRQTQKGRSAKAGCQRAAPSGRGQAQQGAAERGAINRKAAPPQKADYDSLRQEFRGVRLTSPDKVLYPEHGITKLELARYYTAVAEWILPHIAHRPIVLVRCPEGREKECFYQKHPGAGTPATLRQIPIRETSEVRNYVVVDDIEGLVSLAQVGALEIHAWGSREDKLEYPDRLVFDLDPDPAVPWPRVVAGARQVRAFLDDLGLESFLKTTGGKGLHLVVPIDRRHDWDESKAFCRQVAESIVAADPQHYTANMAKAARRGKIFVDYLRNGRGATAIVAYSTRARPGAPVSVPLAWKELTPRIRSDKFTIRNLPRRLASLKEDPWQGIASVRQGLAGPLERLAALGAR
jgi:bifunctional non-homologous end joining protein LigD